MRARLGKNFCYRCSFLSKIVDFPFHCCSCCSMHNPIAHEGSLKDFQSDVDPGADYAYSGTQFQLSDFFKHKECIQVSESLHSNKQILFCGL